MAAAREAAARARARAAAARARARAAVARAAMARRAANALEEVTAAVAPLRCDLLRC